MATMAEMIEQGHHDYPHEEGHLPGCPACEEMFSCDTCGEMRPPHEGNDPGGDEYRGTFGILVCVPAQCAWCRGLEDE